MPKTTSHPSIVKQYLPHYPFDALLLHSVDSAKAQITVPTFVMLDRDVPVGRDWKRHLTWGLDSLRELKDLLCKHLNEEWEGTLFFPVIWYGLYTIVGTSQLPIDCTHSVCIATQVHCGRGNVYYDRNMQNDTTPKIPICILLSSLPSKPSWFHYIEYPCSEIQLHAHRVLPVSLRYIYLVPRVRDTW